MNAKQNFLFTEIINSKQKHSVIAITSRQNTLARAFLQKKQLNFLSEIQPSFFYQKIVTILL